MTNIDTYDAIVIGSGISGGWAARELCEKGLRTLVLERGPNVEHVKDYTTATMHPWQFDHRLEVPTRLKAINHAQSLIADEADLHFFANEKDHPYQRAQPFNWVRGYQVGGKSLTWGRQCYRMSDLDFEANAKEGIGVDWPIRYKDLEPWYAYVEEYVGISGAPESLPHFPDGKFLPPIDMNCVEDYFNRQLRSHYRDRIATISRVANLTRGWNGRGPCQYRNLCSRGCPFGGYFSSNAATLPAAKATGNLTLLPDSVVAEIVYDEQQQRATGVRVIHAQTKAETTYHAHIIFVNASTINTAAILLNSRSKRFPDGLGNDSGQVGRNLMDHFTGTGAVAETDAFPDKYYYGRKPAGIYIPRFRNLDDKSSHPKYLRGFGVQGHAERRSWREQAPNISGFGKKFKEQLLQPGPWQIWLGGWGETLPYAHNRVTLNTNKVDQWNQPLVHIAFQYGENEMKMREDILSSVEEMLRVTGFKRVSTYDHMDPGGSAVHEMGTVRMGRDARTSVLNGFNQMHAVKNVFITDGSCMTSSGTVNPSLTYMALTARACNYAVEQWKQGKL
ncbi:GMC family oxidoreductase [Chitinophaga horti]|uniref:GMC family oxidoreductase n=1 Tax=Chitinophaga horti TaxID=2920382 RepID=A0ABY6IUE8_9BACT|nr:GMC family oxidoreductase [Chitinophaga horti]UYQ90994.1 GMC family oxidoreductase [Chitinophaga horti]